MLKKLKSSHKQREQEVKQRLNDFSKIKGDDIFYELCFCILTPQSNAKKCDEAIAILKKRNFLNSQTDIETILKSKTRFYKNKSKYLIELKARFPLVLKNLNKTNDKELREWLIKNIKGISYKEASHFLRNIGYRNLAILDRHILKNLKKLSIIDEIPKTLTKNKYLEIEKKFYKFSKEINIDMDELDLLFWSLETGEIFK